MNTAAADWQGQFAQGFTSGGDTSGVPLVIGFVLVLAAAVLAWILWDRYQKSRPRMRKAAPAAAPKPKHYVAVAGRINPLQQKVIQEIIDEFRKREPLAQAVPSAILEKYSEYFYNEAGRMSTRDKDVEAFVDGNYPLEEGAGIELDFQSSGSLHLIQSKVLEVDGKHVIAEFQSPIPEFLKRGMPVQVNYHVGKHFLQGNSQITEVRPDLGLILKRPTHVIVTSERRYSRITLKKASGTIQDARTGFQAPVKVIDLSLEGVRVQVGRPLDKTHIHQLSFEEIADSRSWTFGPIECVPSKAFLTGNGTYEAGLLFLYLDVAVKARLIAFMKHVAEELKAAKAAP